MTILVLVALPCNARPRPRVQTAAAPPASQRCSSFGSANESLECCAVAEKPGTRSALIHCRKFGIV
jgi:hypothetical protein